MKELDKIDKKLSIKIEWNSEKLKGKPKEKA